jgi:hypothetical protein
LKKDKYGVPRTLAHFGGTPDHVASVFGLSFVQLGRHLDAGTELALFSTRDRSRGPYRMLAFDGGVLVGANLIGGVEIAGRLRRAIVRRENWEDRLGPLTRVPSDEEIVRLSSELICPRNPRRSRS